jgi:hypothetical protein
MGLFRRKKKENKALEEPGLPELPELPDINRDGGIKMPPLPNSENEEDYKFSQKMMKNEINEDFGGMERSGEMENSEFEIIRPKNKNPLTRELEEDSLDFETKIKPKQKPLSSRPIQIPRKNESFVAKIPTTRTEPLFIRVDKYKGAVDKIQDIKQKLIEIEKLLSDIKEVKNKEEFELEAWDKEIQEAKAKIDVVDKLLFSQLGD